MFRGSTRWISALTLLRLTLESAIAAYERFLADYPEWRKFVTDRTLGGSCRDVWRDAGLLDFILDDLPRQQAPWQVTVDGRELPLMTGRALRGVFSFASFEVKGGEKVVATAPDGKVERFTATGPFRRTFKPYGARNALALFGDAPETDVPDRNDPKVKWFGPGEHRPGAIRLTDGETLYLAPGVSSAWKDYAFRLPAPGGLTIDMAVKGGRVERLTITCAHPSAARKVRIVPPAGLGLAPQTVVLDRQTIAINLPN